MQAFSPSLPPGPRLPRPLALPLGLIPRPLHSKALALALNRLFARELQEGELDFLTDRVMAVRVQDAGLEYRLGLLDGRLLAAPAGTPADLTIEGSLYDFLLLASRREDADTLFFNRRLRLGGDTELGLYVKNFLDGLELEGRLGPLAQLIDGAATLAGRLGGRGA
jgi:O2-independent ubiquinone biosynthesis accessory factor UbiT